MEWYWWVLIISGVALVLRLILLNWFATIDFD